MDIERIKIKLRRLIELNPSGDYGFINDPLSEEKILLFESENKIKLPKDYRTFISKMFDGGVGPSYILPIEFWDSYYGINDPEVKNELSEPFLLTKKWKENFQQKQVMENPKFISTVNGTIRLSDIGCGSFLFLVVNGLEYGNIWVDNRASNGEIFPLTGKYKQRLNFEDWYNEWLDEEIKHFKA